MLEKANQFCMYFVKKFKEKYIYHVVGELLYNTSMSKEEWPALIKSLYVSERLIDKINSERLCDYQFNYICRLLEEIIHHQKRLNTNEQWIRYVALIYFQMFLARCTVYFNNSQCSKNDIEKRYWQKHNANSSKSLKRSEISKKQIDKTENEDESQQYFSNVDRKFSQDKESSSLDASNAARLCEYTNKIAIANNKSEIFEISQFDSNTFPTYLQEDLNTSNLICVFKLLLFRNTYSAFDVYKLLRALVLRYRHDCNLFMKNLLTLRNNVLLTLNRNSKANNFTDITERDLCQITASASGNRGEKNLTTIIGEMIQLNKDTSGEQHSQRFLNRIRTVIKTVQDYFSSVNQSLKLGCKNTYKKSAATIKSLQTKLSELKADLITTRPKKEIKKNEDLVKFLIMTSIAVFLSSQQKYLPKITQCISYCILVLKSAACSCCGLLKSETKVSINENCGYLLEVKTGEGKSCIVAMTAATLAITGECVDVVTTSSVLAERDYAEWEEFYSWLDLKVICNNVYYDGLYCNHIIYGTVGSFARDMLVVKFLSRNVRGNRKNDVVLIDEVDSMLLDQATHCTYINCDTSSTGIKHLEPVLAYIWRNVSQYGRLIEASTGNVLYHGKLNAFHKIIRDFVVNNDKLIQCLQQAESKIEIVSIKQILSSDYYIEKSNALLAEITTEDMISYFKLVSTLFSHENIFFEIYVLQENKKLKNISDNKCNKHKNGISILVCENGIAARLYHLHKLQRIIAKQIKERISADNTSFSWNFPSFLSLYVKNRVSYWIKNAFLALQLTENREYVIRDKHIITPVDFKNSGILETSKRWSNGLQQFLEMKHMLPLTLVPLVANYLSNISFFKNYNKIIGVSGTLGSKRDIDFMKEYYGINYCIIPRIRPEMFYEVEGLLLDNESEWIEAINSVMSKELKSLFSDWKGRSGLILCEDIKSVYSLKRTNVTTYCRNDEQNEIENVTIKVDQGTTVIATNLGSRGTDYKITSEVDKCGGLYEILTFLPYNDRVQEQAYGRTARQGYYGAAQMILNRNLIPKRFRHCATINEIKCELENNQAKLFSNKIKETELIRLKEKLLNVYCLERDEYIKHSNSCEMLKAVEFNLLNDKWALWIETRPHNSDKLNKLGHKDVKKLCKSMFWLKASFHRPRATFYRPQTNLYRSQANIYNKKVNLHKHKTNLYKLSVKWCRPKTNWFKSSASWYEPKTNSTAYNFYHYFNYANISDNDDFNPIIYRKKMKLLDKIINSHKIWSAFAHYNRAYHILTCQENSDYISMATNDLLEAQKKLSIYKNEVLYTYICIILANNDITVEEKIFSRFSEYIIAKGRVISYIESNIEHNIKQLSLHVNSSFNDKTDFKKDHMALNSLFSCSNSLMEQIVNEFSHIGCSHLFTLDNIYFHPPIYSTPFVFNVCLGIVQLLSLNYEFINIDNVDISNLSKVVKNILQEMANLSNQNINWESWNAANVILSCLFENAGVFKTVKGKYVPNEISIIRYLHENLYMKFDVNIEHIEQFSYFFMHLLLPKIVSILRVQVKKLFTQNAETRLRSLHNSLFFKSQRIDFSCLILLILKDLKMFKTGENWKKLESDEANILYVGSFEIFYRRILSGRSVITQLTEEESSHISNEIVKRLMPSFNDEYVAALEERTTDCKEVNKCPDEIIKQSEDLIVDVLTDHIQNAISSKLKLKDPIYKAVCELLQKLSLFPAELIDNLRDADKFVSEFCPVPSSTVRYSRLMRICHLITTGQPVDSILACRLFAEVMKLKIILFDSKKFNVKYIIEPSWSVTQILMVEHKQISNSSKTPYGPKTLYGPVIDSKWIKLKQKHSNDNCLFATLCKCFQALLKDERLNNYFYLSIMQEFGFSASTILTESKLREIIAEKVTSIPNKYNKLLEKHYYLQKNTAYDDETQTAVSGPSIQDVESEVEYYNDYTIAHETTEILTMINISFCNGNFEIVKNVSIVFYINISICANE